MLRHALLASTLALAASTLIGSTLDAQTVIDRVQTGNGARAIGMGYAFTAIADDATAIGWNPAGLAQLVLPEASLVASSRGQYPELDFRGDFVDGGTGRFANSLVPLSFASIVVPFRMLNRQVTAGVAYRMMYDWARASDYTVTLSDGNLSASSREQNKRTGGISALSPAIGIELHPMLRVGATVNFLSGATETEETITLSGDFDTPGSTTTKTRTNGYSGTGVEVGALLQPTDRIRLGLRVGLPYDRTSVSRNETTAFPRARLAVPTTYAAGVAIMVGERGQLAVDVRNEPWTQGVQYNDETGEVTVDPASPNDATSFHLGYEVTHEKQGALGATRFGIFNRPSTFNDFAGEQIKAIGVSFGKGWATQRYSFDLATTYLRVAERQFNEGNGPNGAFNYRVTENELLVTASIVFYLK